ncbi:hypothetical protein [Paraburkholderia sp. BCC1876]|uniref:hypothetical protein n=1 Tax=Paraburkholderia sp. BCC1876 TaxID=2676303 RepID=UPI001590A01A|nr:hypothetical protein [Paraburkholderia sp. BCC1876]
MRKATPRLPGKMLRDAMRARRQMMRDGELVPEDEFRRLRGVTPTRLARLNKSGSVFSIEIDGSAYYPRLLVDPRHNARRLAYVCRVLWPAPPASRLDFLTSENSALGGITPLQALAIDCSYRELLTHAKGWASEFCLTTVMVCKGAFLRDIELPVVCTGYVEADPRERLWRRVAEALEAGGNLSPDGPYCQAKLATVFVSRNTAGKPGELREARFDVIVAKGLAHTGVVTADAPRYDLNPVRVDKSDDIVAVIRKVLAACE